MSVRTRFLSRLIGLYLVIVAVAMGANKQSTVAMVTELIHSPSLLFMVGLLVLVAGLALVLDHNVWSGDSATIVVTLVGWLAAAKGALFLLMSPETAATIYLGAFRYEQLFYLYVGISLALGAFLALRGFAHKG